MTLNVTVRLQRFILPAFITAFLLVGCSDILLEPQRQPTNLITDKSGVLSIIGTDFELNVKLVDNNGVPFKIVPAWVDTTYTGADGRVIKISNGDVITVQPGVTDLGIEIAGFFEEIEVRVALVYI